MVKVRELQLVIDRDAFLWYRFVVILGANVTKEGYKNFRRQNGAKVFFE